MGSADQPTVPTASDAMQPVRVAVPKLDTSTRSDILPLRNGNPAGLRRADRPWHLREHRADPVRRRPVHHPVYTAPFSTIVVSHRTVPSKRATLRQVPPSGVPRHPAAVGQTPEILSFLRNELGPRRHHRRHPMPRAASVPPSPSAATAEAQRQRTPTPDAPETAPSCLRSPLRWLAQRKV